MAHSYARLYKWKLSKSNLGLSRISFDVLKAGNASMHVGLHGS